jgi:hypothetical protein
LPRLRVSLRGLLLAMALVVAPVCYWTHTAIQQRQAAEAIRSLGGQVYYDYHFAESRTAEPDESAQPTGRHWLGNWPGVDFFHRVEGVRYGSFATAAADDGGLNWLARLPHVHWLAIHGTGVSDDGLAALRDLAELRRLTLYATGLTDGCVDHLASLDRIERLEIDYTQITDRGAARLREALPSTRVEY